MATETTVLSPNLSSPSRVNECAGVVWHHSSGSYIGGVEWIQNPQSKVSYHCLIAKDGRRTVFAPDERIAWHAGKSKWKGREFCNAFTLGVAFEGDTHKYDITQAQIESAIEWLSSRAKKYGWTMDDMTTHRAVSPGRKNDISPAAECVLFAAIAKILK